MEKEKWRTHSKGQRQVIDQNYHSNSNTEREKNMIKVENHGGEVVFQSDGTMLDLAQEILAIRHFIKRNPEIEQMADFIEMISSVERQDFESTEELEKEIGTSKEDGLTHTEDVIKKAFRKKMN